MGMHLLWRTMIDDKPITDFRELVRCYDLMNDANSPVLKEINMWRKRFIDSQNLSEIHKVYFYAIPSENLMKTTPEDLIKSYSNE